MKKIAIIGGGASGLVAALSVARSFQGNDVPAEICIYEADDRVGRTILATGNGRCNFSNANPAPEVYRGAAFVEEVFESLSARYPYPVVTGSGLPSGYAAENPVQDFFARMGLVWREEAEGRLYPFANKATSVLEVLRAALVAANVHEVCEVRISQIDAPSTEGGSWNMRCTDGRVFHVDAVILAIGGRGLGSVVLPDDLRCLPTKPVLGPLCTNEEHVRALNNIRVRCGVSLLDASGVLLSTERGEVLFRDYGVSGIAIFNLSRFANPGDLLHLDFLPDFSFDQVIALLEQRASSLAGSYAVGSSGAKSSVTVEALLRGVVLPPIAKVLARVDGMKLEQTVEDPSVLHRVATQLKSFELVVKGVGDERQCQVRRGGLQLTEFNATTLSASKYPGLFACGEALDVDAPCGGYNLHWAWASGMLAGMAAAASVGIRAETGAQNQNTSYQQGVQSKNGAGQRRSGKQSCSAKQKRGR